MADGEVVIRDDAGTEHVFPQGFDVQRAIGIVRAETYRPNPTMTGAATRAIARSAGGIGIGMPAATDELGEPLQKPNPIVNAAVTNPALQSLAHPTSLSDVSALLVPSAVPAIVGRLVAPAAQAASKYGGAAADLVSSLLPARAQAALSTLRDLSPTAWNNPLTVAGREGRAVVASKAFNAQPLSRQMEQLPDVPAPLAGRLRMAPPTREMPSPIDRYAPNISADSHAMTGAAEAMPRGLTQGVYAQMPDGSWGIKALPGHQLVEGEAVNVMSRAGAPKVITVGKVGPDGLAALGTGSLPPEPISIGGQNVTDPKVLEMIRQRLSSDQP